MKQIIPRWPHQPKPTQTTGIPDPGQAHNLKVFHNFTQKMPYFTAILGNFPHICRHFMDILVFLPIFSVYSDQLGAILGLFHGFGRFLSVIYQCWLLSIGQMCSTVGYLSHLAAHSRSNMLFIKVFTNLLYRLPVCYTVYLSVIPFTCLL